MSNLAKIVMAGGFLALASISIQDRAIAQSPGVDRTEYERLFKTILRKPSDLNANLRFAEVAIGLKEYEAAIGAFERLLFYNPGNADVQLQLGRLYLQLESRQMARQYFQAASSSPTASADLRNQAQAYLAQIDGVVNKPWSLYANLGARFQTNANSGPNALFVKVFGQSQAAPNQTSKKSDWNAFALASASYAHVFNDRNDTLEFNVATYYALQARLSQLDLGLIDLAVGPRFQLPNEVLPNLSVRGYAIGTYTALGGSTYFTGPGAGVSVRHDLGSVATIEHFGEYRRKNYENSSDYPTAKDQTGDLWSYVLQTSGTITGRLRWVSRFTLNHNDARTPFNRFTQQAVDLALPFDFDAPVAIGTGAWTIAPTIGFSHSAYSGPDPSVDPGVTRRDDEWRVGARLDIPIYGNFGFSTQLQYSMINSNIPNYDTRNFAVSFGTTLRF